MAPYLRAQFATMLRKILIGVGVLLIALVVLVVAGLYVYPKAQIVSATQQAAPDFTLKVLRARISIWPPSVATKSCCIFIAGTGDPSA